LEPGLGLALVPGQVSVPSVLPVHCLRKRRASGLVKE
jgi:hypothetical protein